VHATPYFGEYENDKFPCVTDTDAFVEIRVIVGPPGVYVGHADRTRLPALLPRCLVSIINCLRDCDTHAQRPMLVP